MVEFAHRGPCKTLLKTLDRGVDRDANGAIAGISYTDFQKQVMFWFFTPCCMLRTSWHLATAQHDLHDQGILQRCF